MTKFLHTQSDLDRALRQLIRRDPRLNAVLARAGSVALRQREAGFAGLLATIVGQQLSIASAAAIWARLSTAFDPLNADAIHRARADRLGRLGLSAAKIRTFKAIAREIRCGQLDLDSLGTQPADDAHRALIAVHGIGPWTADIYLLFCLGHGDAWPAGDLALQAAIAHALGLNARPDARALTALADVWRPWRGVAAHLFWAYYKAIKTPASAAPSPPPRAARRTTRTPR